MSMSAAVAAAEPIDHQTCFRPGPTSCTALVIWEIDSARRSIDPAAYSLTDMRIVDALNHAATRGVTVRSVVDRESALAGMLPGEVWTDCRDAIQHNKFLVLDGIAVGTGSFNLSKAAEYKNAENHIWLRDKVIAGEYAENFRKLITESQPGVGCSEQIRRRKH